MKRVILVIFLLCGAVFTGIVFAQDKVIIFAAASTTDAMNEIIATYTKNNNVDIKASYTGSGSLARQIEQGAPANIFLSAATEWIVYLKNKNLLVDSSIKQILTSKLVLIGMKKIDNVTMSNFADYVSKNNVKIAVGDPKTVPAGAYTEEVFNKLKIKNIIAKKLIYSNSVRTALNYVKLGEVEFAFVYLSDTVGVKGDFKILDIIDSDLHTPITYDVAIVAGKNTAAVEKFYNYLLSDESKKIFKKYGF